MLVLINIFVTQLNLEWRSIRGQSLYIDIKSSYSFLNEDMSEELKVAPIQATSLVVIVANGKKTSSTTSCLDFTSYLQGHTFFASMRILKLGGVM